MERKNYKIIEMIKTDTINSTASKRSTQSNEFHYQMFFSYSNDPSYFYSYNCLKEIHQKYKPVFLTASKGGFFTKVENDYNCAVEFEKLMNHYFLIITIALRKNNFKKANDFFLLMMKETNESLQFIFEKLIKNIPKIDLKNNIGKFYPKIVIIYLKICSCLIKLSGKFSKFGLQKNCIVNYIRVFLLVYQRQLKIIESTGTIVSKDKLTKINYFLSFFLFNLSSFNVWNYSRLSVPISILEKIKALYNSKCELDLSNIENTILIKTLYNLGVLHYVNNSKGEAFSNLNLARELFLSSKQELKEYTKSSKIIRGAKKHFSLKQNYLPVMSKEEILSSKTPRASKVYDFHERKVFINIELMIGEIELDNHNYENAHKYVKSALNLITSFKKEIKKYKTRGEIRKIDKFLSEIEKQFPDPENKENNTYKTIETIDLHNDAQFKRDINESTTQTIEEIEKFFILLSTLSIYQIKVLNECQPKEGGNRDYLPIMFPNQFKDCLTYSQRIILDQMNVMGLLRYIVLKDPRKGIYPNNLNYQYLSLRDRSLLTGRESRKQSKVSLPLNQGKDYEKFEKIINSNSISESTKNFLIRHLKYVIKILKRTTEKELLDMINYPDILIEPIKEYISEINSEKRKSIFYMGDGNEEEEINLIN